MTMKVILIATLTADGFIAQASDHLTNWSSKEDKALFVEVTKAAGIMVMGARTFATIGRALPGRRTIVLTHHPERITAEGVETSLATPAQLLTRLEHEGATSVAICGGAEVYTQFMEASLVTEMYLVTEPILFGSGLTLCNRPMNAQLELIDSIKRNQSVINHYRVKHS